MTDVPPQAITAAASVLTRVLAKPGDELNPNQLALDQVLAKRVLDAAAPHLAAAERDACAQLAEQVGASYLEAVGDDDPISLIFPFADLLRGGGEAPKEDHHD